MSRTRCKAGLILVLLLLSSHDLPAQNQACSASNLIGLLRLGNTGMHDTVMTACKRIIDEDLSCARAFDLLVDAYKSTKRIDEGIEYFERISAGNPESGMAFRALGLLEAARGNHRQAVRQLLRCVEADPAISEAWHDLLDISAVQAEAVTADDVLAYAERSRMPADQLLLVRGYACQKQGKWSEAEALYRQAAAKESASVRLLFNLANVLDEQKKWPQALEVWLSAAGLAERNGLHDKLHLICTNIGGTFMASGRHDEAIGYYRRARAVARDLGNGGDEIEYARNLAIALLADNQPQNALSTCDTALALARALGDPRSEAMMLHLQCDILNEVGGFPEALKAGYSALDYYEQSLDSLRTAGVLAVIAASHAQMGDIEKAAGLFRKSLSISIALRDTHAIINRLSNLGMYYKETGRIRTAIDTFHAAYDMARVRGDAGQQRLLLYQIGFSYAGLGQLTEALQYFRASYALADSLGDEAGLALAGGNIGIVLKNQGYTDSALVYLNSALSTDEKLSIQTGVIRHLANIANLHEMKGEYPEALRLQQRALELSNRSGTIRHSIVLLGNMGAIYDNIGDYENAMHCSITALSLARRHSYQENLPRCLSRIGVVYEHFGRDSLALEYYRESLKAAEHIGNEVEMAEAMHNIGVIHERRNEAEKAMDGYGRAREMYLNGGYALNAANSSCSLASVLVNANRLEEAGTLYKGALAAGYQAASASLIVDCMMGLGLIAQTQSVYDSALACYDAAIQLIEAVAENLKIDGRQDDYIDRSFRHYQAAIGLLLTIGKTDDAYGYVQRFRGRSLLTAVSSRKYEFTAGIDSQRLSRLMEAELDLKELYGRLVIPAVKNDKRLLDSTYRMIDDMRFRHERLLDEIRLNHPRWLEGTGRAKPISIMDAKNAAAASGTAVIEYFLAYDFTTAWVILGDTAHFLDLGIKGADVEILVERFRRPFHELSEGKIRNFADVGFDAQAAAKLYDAIFRPLEEYLPGGARLTIIADGALHYLPFEALVTGGKRKSGGGGRKAHSFENLNFLIEKYSIRYLPSAGLAAAARDTTRARGGDPAPLTGCFGDPDYGKFAAKKPALMAIDESKIALKAASGLRFGRIPAKDARDIARIMQPSEIWLRGEASEKRFKAVAGRYRHIYLSTHAVADDRRPMYSYVVLAQDEKSAEDGFLHAYEVFNMDINADLVTLSACETGVGKVSRGDGMMSLARAFLYAGVKSLVVSLWKVDVLTTRIMTQFHRNIAAGRPVDEALRAAKLKLLRGRKAGNSYAHPFLWAPFVLVGEGTQSLPHESHDPRHK